MEQTIKWHYISKDGMPKVEGERAKAFLICYRAELARTFEINGRKEQIPAGEYIELTSIALLQNKDSQDGWAYTPANKFYWGADIFSDVYAWAEFPKAAPYESNIE